MVSVRTWSRLRGFQRQTLDQLALLLTCEAAAPKLSVAHGPHCSVFHSPTSLQHRAPSRLAQRPAAAARPATSRRGGGKVHPQLRPPRRHVQAPRRQRRPLRQRCEAAARRRHLCAWGRCIGSRSPSAGPWPLCGLRRRSQVHLHALPPALSMPAHQSAAGGINIVAHDTCRHMDDAASRWSLCSHGMQLHQGCSLHFGTLLMP